MGWKAGDIKKWVMGTLAFMPGQTTCDICRQLNGGAKMFMKLRENNPSNIVSSLRVKALPIEFCKWKSCYANARKRAKPHHVSKCNCTYSLQLVAYHLKTMVKKGMLTVQREFRTDNFQNRGYDFYTCYYPA